MDASQLIDKRIAALADWRGERMAQVRRLIRSAATELVEEWKWDTPVWSFNGNVVAIGAFHDHIKVNFFKGAALNDPHHLFNAGLEAKTTRAIDIFEKDEINESALQELIRSAVSLNTSKPKPSTKPSAASAGKNTPAPPKKKAPPKIPKAKKKK